MISYMHKKLYMILIRREKKIFLFENNFEGLVTDRSYCQDDLRNLTFFVLQSRFRGSSS